MLRISIKNEPRCSTITIDGQLAGDDVDAVENCCEEAATLGRRARLFLRDVSNIDARGITLLRRLASKGFELSACGLYSSYLVEEVRRHAGSRTAAAAEAQRWQNKPSGT